MSVQIDIDQRYCDDAPRLGFIRRERSRRSIIQAREELDAVGLITLVDFIKLAWHVVEPTRKYIHGWHIEAIAEHLEAIIAGQLLRLAIAIPPGMMKPNHVESLVLTKRGRIKLGEVIIGDKILTHKGRFRSVSAVHTQGVLPLLSVTTEHGRNNKTAVDHPYLTTRGWIQAKDLLVGDVLAAVTPIEEGFIDRIIPEEARLLGYLVGDGSCTHSPSFTNMDREIIADFQRCAKVCGFDTSISQTKGKATKVGLRGALLWLERHGMRGKNSRTKRIPADVLASGRNIIANFVGAYWSCDGQIVVRHTHKRGSTYFSNATTVGAELASDLQHALLRLGINSRVRSRSRIVNGDDYKFFMVHTCAHKDTVLFKDMPGLCEQKNIQLSKLSPRTFVQGPLFEDKITKINKADAGECRCLTVDEDASFVANDLAVHNSLLTAVFFPAWLWGPVGQPSKRIIGFSHDQELATRDALRCRQLMMSQWYQTLWGDRFSFSEDQNVKTRYTNDQTGFRISDYVGGGTGDRGDVLIIDDPHQVKDPESDVKRLRAVNWLHETLPTRLNDPEKTAIIVIHHRLHEQDMIGEILACDLGYEYLCLPQEFETKKRCRTKIGFVDPRKKENELLFPERFPRAVVERDKKAMGQYAVAGQFQQRPSPRGGGMIKRDWFSVVGEAPADTRWVRWFDLAATENAGAYTCGVLMGYSAGTKCFYIRDVVRGQLDDTGAKRLVMQTAALDVVDVGKRMYQIWLPQDPGQAGKVQAKDFIKSLVGYDVHAERETGDKVTRARPFAAQAEAGNVKLVQRDGSSVWIKTFLDECAGFPTGKYRDQVDACSGAFGVLVLYRKQTLGQQVVRGQI